MIILPAKLAKRPDITKTTNNASIVITQNKRFIKKLNYLNYNIILINAHIVIKKLEMATIILKSKIKIHVLNSLIP